MTFIILGLATYYLTHIITEYEGPFGIFYKLQNTRLFKATLCFTCLSVWIGGLLSLLVAQNVPEWILFTLSSAGVAVLLDRWND